MAITKSETWVRGVGRGGMQGRGERPRVNEFAHDRGSGEGQRDRERGKHTYTYTYTYIPPRVAQWLIRRVEDREVPGGSGSQ